MAIEKREETRPCFCGQGRITECWFEGTWSSITLQCAGCDRAYEYKLVERGEDGTEKMDWVKRSSELKPELPEGRENPSVINHDYAGTPVYADLFGFKFASDGAGHTFAQPTLTVLKEFDTAGSLYVMKSDSIPDYLKIGITNRRLRDRAKEHTKDFYLQHPFQTVAAWKMRNYQMVEYFLLRRMMHLRSSYVKARSYFFESRIRKLCVRTHRSTELYKCCFDEAYAQVSLILNKAPDLVEYEQWLLKWLTERLDGFRVREPWEAGLIGAWQRALDTMRERLSAGETSMCALETLHAAS